MQRDSRFARDTAFAGLMMAALGGCIAIPVGITAASAGFDGMSYVSTGKAPHDHALSAITGEDCAVWRVVKEKPVCVEPKGTGAHAVVYAPGNGALAFAPPAMTPVGISPAPEKAPEATITTESLAPPAPAPQVAAIAPAAPLPAQPVAASLPPLRASEPPRATVPANARTVAYRAPAPVAAPAANGRKVLVVLGSFQDAERAAAASSATKGTRVITAMIEGRKMYRVVAGPFESQQAESMRRNVSEKAWLLPI